MPSGIRRRGLRGKGSFIPVFTPLRITPGYFLNPETLGAALLRRATSIYLPSSQSQTRSDTHCHWKPFLNPTRSEPTTGGAGKDSSRQGAKLAKAPPLFPLRLCARIQPLTDSNWSTFHWVANPCKSSPHNLQRGHLLSDRGQALVLPRRTIASQSYCLYFSCLE